MFSNQSSGECLPRQAEVVVEEKVVVEVEGEVGAVEGHQVGPIQPSNQ